MQTVPEKVEENHALKIVARKEKPLSKIQNTFNRLVKQIEMLEKSIESEKAKLSNLLGIYSKEVTPLHSDVANERIRLAMALGKATEVHKFNKKQIEKIQKTIIILCEDAFESIEPNAEQEAFYNTWSGVSYKEEMEYQKNAEKEMFSDFMKDVYGMNIDMDGFDEGPEGFARFQQKVKEQFEQSQQQFQQNNANGNAKAKTKKQQEKENAVKAEEEIKNKGIRSLYITLAKLLHPDVETDEALKAEKNEIMKKVTVAYDQKDLVTLLRLEMEWVHKTTEHLEKLEDEKLKTYIIALKQQAAELQKEKSLLYHHPLYAQISDYVYMPEKYAMSAILKDRSELKRNLKDLKKMISECQRSTAKVSINIFVEEFCLRNDFDDDFDDDFFVR